MANKQKARNFIKEHVPEIIAVGSVAVAAITGATLMKIHLTNPMPHKLTVRSDSKDFIEGLRSYINWNGGKRFESSHVGFGLTETEAREFVTGRISENSDDYLYGIMIEKLKK